MASRADAKLDQVLGQLALIGADRTPAGAVVHLAIGERDRRGGDLRAAAARFELTIELLEAMPRSAWLANAHLLLAAVHRDLGDPAAAVADLDHADDILDRLPDPGDLRERSERLRELLAAPVRRASEFGEQLTDREMSVLRLAAAGLGQRQIAEQLFISYNTVKSHLKTSYRKLGVTSRDEAVARFVALELTHDERDPAVRLTRVTRAAGVSTTGPADDDRAMGQLACTIVVVG